MTQSFKLVPVEPDENMMEAGYESLIIGDISKTNWNRVVLAYKKMLSAAPDVTCQHGKDVGMPEYSCASRCVYQDHPSRTAELEDKVKRLVEALTWSLAQHDIEDWESQGAHMSGHCTKYVWAHTLLRQVE